MKAKLDEHGHFYLQRRNEMKRQYCPYRDNWISCGDWCPLFNTGEDKDGGYYIYLCNSFHEVEELIYEA